MARTKKHNDLRLTPLKPDPSTGWPVLVRTNGFDLALTPKHVDEVEGLVSNGASKKYIARTLGVSEAELDRAIKVCPPLQAAIENGVANDEFEVAQVLRRSAVRGDFAAMNLYLKAKHGWRDRDAAGGGHAAPSINITISGLLERGIEIQGETV